MNSRSSTHWKLCDQTGEVLPILQEVGQQEIISHEKLEEQDDNNSDPGSSHDERLMRVINLQKSLKHFSQGDQQVWIQDGSVSQSSMKELSDCSNSCTDSSNKKKSLPRSQVHESESKKIDIKPEKDYSISKDSSNSNKRQELRYNLTCAPYSNLTTQYDHLAGIEDRFILAHYPEPEVANIFKKKGATELNLNALESRLRDNKVKRPKAPQVYNQIGNFLRIFGNTREAIECFRRALHLSPNHPDVLLNLARVLFNHNYLEDAIYLTRRSLETQPPERNSWLQHFTLGQILKAYGHLQEAAFHFRHALDLNPGFSPTKAELRELDLDQNPSVTYYTLFIICFLVMVVLCGLLTTIDNTAESYSESGKTHRHFNRAMAMKTLKLGLNPKVKMRRCVPISSGQSANAQAVNQN